MKEFWFLAIITSAVFLVCGCEHNHRHGATYDAGDFAYDSLDFTGEAISTSGDLVFAALAIPALPLVLLEEGLSSSSKPSGPTFQQAYQQPTSSYFAESRSAQRSVTKGRKVKAGDRVWKID